MTFQVKSLLHEWHSRSDSAEWVLGVVYKTEGPCYRKPGAMMFFSSHGEQYGLLSGGCLEADIQLQARKVMQSGRALTLCYDSNDEDDISFQLGIGCGGTVYILLVPISDQNDYIQLKEIYRALCQRQSSQLELKIPDKEGEVESRLCSETDAQDNTSTAVIVMHEEAEWLSVTIKREPHLLVVGGGVDASPVVALARELGWEVTLWDSRPANARREFFMSASNILDCSVEELGQIAFKEQVDAAILMTHNIALDAAALRVLSQTPLKYLGLLGPISRKKKVLLAAEFDEQQEKLKVSGPAGFDLGGELPESIALSILSECHACLYTGTPSSAKSLANA